jgi:hypothetical protein
VNRAGYPFQSCAGVASFEFFGDAGQLGREGEDLYLVDPALGGVGKNEENVGILLH